VTVPTLNGQVKLKVPAGTSSGKTFRIRGRGVQRQDGSKGDLLATVQVAVPQKLSSKQKELVRQLAEDDESPRRHLEV
jgi:molecular chaperone DnaJ